VRQSYAVDVARLQAVQQKAELHIQSFVKQLQQKTPEFSELTAICDELVSKVGHGAC